MGVAVLSPQDCLQNPLSSRRDLISLPPRMKPPPRNPNGPDPKANRSNRPQPNRRKRSPNTSPPSRAAVLPKVVAAPVIGQVKILKRGEQLPKTTPEKVLSQPIKIEMKNKYGDLGSTQRLGPDPELVPTGSRARLTEPDNSKVHGFYAGSAFITSPPPSSLPLPAFFMKKSASAVDATSDLRRILGISL
ncbi:uncharacterized protein LOC8274216 [Ricinus communis]|uniref:Uncharacterized protein n=1 Tax=Ricinus communis TaxID=3988 RepID=B9RNY9_RICCO|nr:uncharacterized protein LOC8274216 [Ricinus communis]EEF46907.1 conserved hypothetical protein [Ricinus communis]|eukprot:XP_002515458.1 uncharacterized protein LOC8274216 [Ricinus communis]